MKTKMVRPTKKDLLAFRENAAIRYTLKDEEEYIGIGKVRLEKNTLDIQFDWLVRVRKGDNGLIAIPPLRHPYKSCFEDPKIKADNGQNGWFVVETFDAVILLSDKKEHKDAFEKIHLEGIPI